MSFGFLSEKGSFNMLTNLYTSFGCEDFQSFTIRSDDLADFLEKREFEGITLSRTFQRDAYYICDEVDDQARLCQLVNCIRNEHGKLIGTNTDFDGILYTLKKKNITLKNKVVLIVGNGQVAKVTKAVCKYSGAKVVKTIYYKTIPGSISYKEAYEHYQNADIIINTIFAGKKNIEFKSPIDIFRFPKLSFVMDFAYDPLLSRILVDAKQRNIPFANGLKAFIFTHYTCMQHFGFSMLETDLDLIETNMIKSRCNIVFIGMPSSGKTSMGKRLHRRLNKKWLDVDIHVVHQENKTIPEIFEKDGEEGFRAIETKYVKEISSLSNTIISCGGGVITKDINMIHLSQNGLIIHLDRPLEFLKKKDNRRPLLKNNTVEELYTKRYPIYQMYADFTIQTGNSKDDAAQQILTLLENADTYNKFK